MNKRYISLDLEFGNNECMPVELGLYDIDTGKQESYFINLGKDEKGHKIKQHWYHVKRIHHITDDMIKNAPEFNVIYKRHIEPLINDPNVVIIGWSLTNDLRSIKRACKRYNIEIDVDYKGLCVQELIQNKPFELSSMKLSNVVKTFELSYKGNAHRAGADAQITGELFEMIRNIPNVDDSEEANQSIWVTGTSKKELYERRKQKNK